MTEPETVSELLDLIPDDGDETPLVAPDGQAWIARRLDLGRRTTYLTPDD